MSAPAATQPSRLGLGPWKLLVRALLSPAFLVFIVLALVGEQMIAGLTYVFLRSCLAVPSGVFVYIALAAAISVLIGSVSFLIRQSVRRQQARKQGVQLRPALWFLPVMALSLHLLVASAVAIVLLKGMQDPEALYKVRGKLTVMSPRQNLQRVLSTMEKRGVFTSFHEK